MAEILSAPEYPVSTLVAAYPILDVYLVAYGNSLEFPNREIHLRSVENNVNLFCITNDR